MKKILKINVYFAIVIDLKKLRQKIKKLINNLIKSLFQKLNLRFFIQAT